MIMLVSSARTITLASSSVILSKSLISIRKRDKNSRFRDTSRRIYQEYVKEVDNFKSEDAQSINGAQLRIDTVEKARNEEDKKSKIRKTPQDQSNCQDFNPKSIDSVI
jgi:hypothetical protein